MQAITSFIIVLFFAVTAHSMVTLETVTVGAPNNDNDDAPNTGYGAVSYVYEIGKYEVTNTQYVAFLNAKAATDSLGLFNGNMQINRSGTSGSYTYSTSSGDHPVISVSFWNALRFANWMHNGQGSGDTETGSYTLTTIGIENNSITRNPGATWAVTTEDEWYKAAYYESVGDSYYTYATQYNSAPTASGPTDLSNHSNYLNSVMETTAVGSYSDSSSYFGTFDQNGNLFEWTESIASSTERIYRGGSYSSTGTSLLRRTARNPLSIDGSNDTGFRLVLVPEANSVALHSALFLVFVWIFRRILTR